MFHDKLRIDKTGRYSFIRTLQIYILCTYIRDAKKRDSKSKFDDDETSNSYSRFSKRLFAWYGHFLYQSRGSQCSNLGVFKNLHVLLLGKRIIDTVRIRSLQLQNGN